MAREKTADANLPVRLSQQLKEQAQKKADSLGISISEYIRHLIINDVEQPK